MQRSNRIVLMLSGGVLLSGLLSGMLALSWDAVKTFRSRSADAEAVLPNLVPAFGSQGSELADTDTNTGAAYPVSFTRTSKPDATIPRFSVVPLDTKLGGRRFFPVALNNRGDVLGGVMIDEAEGRQRFRLDAYIFRQNTLTRLPPLPGFKYSWPMAMNNLGQIICIAYESEDSAQNGMRQATVTPALPGDSNAPSRLGDGQRGVSPPPMRRIALWHQGEPRDLRIADLFAARGISNDTLDTLGHGRIGLNDHGQVTLALDSLYWWAEGQLHLAGGRVPLSAPLQPLNNQGILVRPSVRSLTSGYDRWSQSTTTRSWVTAEWYDVAHRREDRLAAGEVWDMNDKSEVLCSNILPGRQPARQFFVTSRRGGRRRIATMPGYAANFINMSFINNKGQVVGLATRNFSANLVKVVHPPPSSPQKGPFWYQKDRLYDVNDLLSAKRAWTILQVRDFNDRGEILADAMDAQRKPHTVLLRPTGTISAMK